MNRQGPEVFEEPTEALAVLDKAQVIAVVDQPSLTVANDYLLEVKALRRRFDDELNPGISQAFAHHRYLVSQKKKFTDPLDRIESLLKPKITAYLIEQDRIRMAAEREAQLAKEAAEKEAEDAADVASALIDEGKIEEANQVVEMQTERIETIKAAAPVIPDKPVAAGASIVERWDFEITDVNLLPRKFMVPDEKAIRKVVQGLHSQADIPGIRVFSTKTISSKVGR